MMFPGCVSMKISAEIAAKYKTGLVLMHLRGDFETMHKQKPVENILQEVSKDFIKVLKKQKISV